MRNITITILIALLSVASLSGCNTFRGAGKDIQRAGEKIQQLFTRN